MKTTYKQNFMAVMLVCALAFISVRADDDLANEYRLTVALHHPIKSDLTGFGQLEYHNNPEKDYQAYEVLWPGQTRIRWNTPTTFSN